MTWSLANGCNCGGWWLKSSTGQNFHVNGDKRYAELLVRNWNKQAKQS